MRRSSSVESLRDYMHVVYVRIRSGESGVLPVVGGFLLISILFQSLNSNFLTAGNLVNLLIQGAAYMLLAMGEIFALLLGEIDLSIGFVSGIGGIVTAELVKQQYGWPWWAAILVALARLRGDRRAARHDHHAPRPAVVRRHARRPARLAGRHAAHARAGRLAAHQRQRRQRLRERQPHAGGQLDRDDRDRGRHGRAARGCTSRAARASGLVAPPASLTVLKIAGTAVAGVVLVLICNTNRGRLIPIKGVPWVVLIVLGVLAAWTFLLGRTKFGRYVYAIGGNAEAARRAGINLARIRTFCFMLASFTAGIAGIVYASRLRSVSTALDGGTLVLYAVAAAVIGGTSLFGGRGKPIHAVLGGLVIAAIDNGMGLQGYSAAAKYVVTALVLLAAVTIDSLARRKAAG